MLDIDVKSIEKRVMWRVGAIHVLRRTGSAAFHAFSVGLVFSALIPVFEAAGFFSIERVMTNMPNSYGFFELSSFFMTALYNTELAVQAVASMALLAATIIMGFYVRGIVSFRRGIGTGNL